MSLVPVCTYRVLFKLPPGWEMHAADYIAHPQAGVRIIWPRWRNCWLVNGSEPRVANDYTEYPTAVQAMAVALGYKLHVDAGRYWYMWHDAPYDMQPSTYYGTADAAAFAVCTHDARTRARLMQSSP